MSVEGNDGGEGEGKSMNWRDGDERSEGDDGLEEGWNVGVEVRCGRLVFVEWNGADGGEGEKEEMEGWVGGWEGEV